MTNSGTISPISQDLDTRSTDNVKRYIQELLLRGNSPAATITYGDSFVSGFR